MAPGVRRVIEAARAVHAARREVARLCTEQDRLHAKLAASDSARDTLMQRRDALRQQLAGFEQHRQSRMDALQHQLEQRLQDELARTRRQWSQQQAVERARRVNAFESRELAALEDSLDEQQRAESDPRRTQLRAEHDALAAQRRTAFLADLQRQQADEAQRRLTTKEASLRAAMAGVLQHMRQHREPGVDHMQQALEEAVAEAAAREPEHAALNSQWDVLAKELEGTQHRLQQVEAEQAAAFAQLERACRKPGPEVSPERLAWLVQAAPYLPPDVADPFRPFLQQLTDTATQEQRLKEERRVQQERERALTLAREVEAQRQRDATRRQNEDEANARQANTVLAGARQLASRGKFEEALKQIGKAQAMHPPSSVNVARASEEIRAVQAQAARREEAERLEQLFSRAVTVFEQGHYDESIHLFEAVIAQEAALDQRLPGLPVQTR